MPLCPAVHTGNPPIATRCKYVSALNKHSNRRKRQNFIPTPLSSPTRTRFWNTEGEVPWYVLGKMNQQLPLLGRKCCFCHRIQVTFPAFHSDLEAYFITSFGGDPLVGNAAPALEQKCLPDTRSHSKPSGPLCATCGPSRPAAGSTGSCRGHSWALTAWMARRGATPARPRWTDTWDSQELKWLESQTGCGRSQGGAFRNCRRCLYTHIFFHRAFSTALCPAL